MNSIKKTTSDKLMKFPLNDVILEVKDYCQKVKNPLYQKGIFSVNPKEIEVSVPNVGDLFISDGRHIAIRFNPESKKDDLQRILSNWGLVGILHQRKSLNFHSSAIEWEGQGILICGDSGAGKSSLTAALCLEGARFISDDITVIDFQGEMPFIRPLENQLALRPQTLDQLPYVGEPSGLNPFSGKSLFEFPFQEGLIPLSQIFWVTPKDSGDIEFRSLTGVEMFQVLRGEICAWEILKGMPETEKDYLGKLLKISERVPLTRVSRLKDSQIQEFAKEVRNFIKNHSEILKKENGK